MTNKSTKSPERDILSVIRHLTSLAATYALGDAFIKGINYLLLPLFTRYLSPYEYGVLAITEMLRLVLSLLLPLGMASAILRKIHVHEGESKRRSFLGSIWIFLIAVPGTMTILLTRYGPQLSNIIFPDIPFNPYFKTILLVSYLQTAFQLLPSTIYRARGQARHYVALGLFNVFCTVIAITYHVVFQNQGAQGWIQGQLEATLALAIVSAFITFGEVSPSFQWSLVKSALLFSLPLVPHFISHWILSVSDRIILERYIGLAQLGIYTLGYQFGQAYQVIITGVNNAIIPSFGRASKDLEVRRMLPQLTTYYLLVIIIVALVIALLGKDVVVLIFPPSYQESIPIVPWVVFGYLAFGIYYIPMNSLTLTTDRTHSVPLITITAASINIVLNLWLVPLLGSIAAAINTTISYSFLAAGMLFLSYRSDHLFIETDRIGKVAISTTLLFIAGRMILRFDPTVNIALGLILIFSLPFLLHVLGFWREEEKFMFLRLRARIFTYFDNRRV